MTFLLSLRLVGQCFFKSVPLYHTSKPSNSQSTARTSLGSPKRCLREPAGSDAEINILMHLHSQEPSTILRIWDHTHTFTHSPLPTKEFKRVNWISFWPLCLCYGAVAILTVTHGGELLYLWIWRNHFCAICATYHCCVFTVWYPKCVRDVGPCEKGNTCLMNEIAWRA